MEIIFNLFLIWVPKGVTDVEWRWYFPYSGDIGVFGTFEQMIDVEALLIGEQVHPKLVGGTASEAKVTEGVPVYLLTIETVIVKSEEKDVIQIGV